MNDILIPWRNQSNLLWNELCAKVVERFGLPGGRFVTEVTEDSMKIKFKNEHDATICRMLLSEHL